MINLINCIRIYNLYINKALNLIKKKFINTENYNISKEKFKPYIQNHDFNLIMALFSRMLLANQWKDYSFSTKKDKIIFCFYKHSYETPIYKIIYEKKSNNYKHWITLYRENMVRTSNSLNKTIQWIESRYLKNIK